MPPSSIVVLASCPDYDRQREAEAVGHALSALGWDWLPPPAPASPSPGPSGPRPLLLKANMLRPSVPEKGVTTHPAVFSAVASCLLARGVRLSWGDSPNGVFTP